MLWDILASNDMDFREERDKNPASETAETSVKNICVRHELVWLVLEVRGNRS